MLGKPAFGWTHIKIGNFEGPASYLTDVPIDCLKNMIFALKNRSDFIVSFDAEGWTYKVVSDCYRTIVIIEKDETPEIILSDINRDELAKELYFDIKNNKEDWYEFPCFLKGKEVPKDERETEAYNRYKQQLNYLLESLEKRLKEIC